MTPSIDTEFRDLIPRLDPSELALLEASIIASRGASDALKVWRGTLLDGHNRLAVCTRLGLPYVTADVPGIETRDDAMLWIEENQLGRRNLSDDQRAAIGLRVMRRRSSAAVAAHSRLAGIASGQARQSNTSDDLTDMFRAEPAPRPAPAAPSPKIDTRAAVAREARVPERKLRAAAEIERQAPEAIGRIARGETSIIQERAKLNAEARAAIAARPIEPPSGKFRTIVIDPPWPMEKIERDVRPNQTGFDYPTMTEEQLAAFPVETMADDNCHLFTWTTHRFLPMALRLIERWGFRYVCTFVWHKPGGFQPIGLPQYNCEFAIYARRGTPKFVELTTFSCCFNAGRREHSRKPDEFYDLVRRVTDGPRIDVFSREAREGFDQHGNEVGRFAA